MVRDPSSEFSEDDIISSSAAAEGDAMMTESGSSEISGGIDASLGQQGSTGADRMSSTGRATRTATRSSTSTGQGDSPTSMAEKRGNRSR
jgi:hypothetical protein